MVGYEKNLILILYSLILKETMEMNEISKENTYKITHISLANCPGVPNLISK